MVSLPNEEEAASRIAAAEYPVTNLAEKYFTNLLKNILVSKD